VTVEQEVASTAGLRVMERIYLKEERLREEHCMARLLEE